MSTSQNKHRLEKIFMIITAIVWVMLSIALPLVNTASIRVFGIPLLWFWVMLWVFIVPVMLSVAYVLLEGG